MITKNLTDKTLSTSYLYRGRIVDVRQDRIKDSKGRIAYREVVEHPGAVAILAIDNEDNLIFVEQYRQPAGKVLLEIPAGKLEPGEDPEDCARRELSEETGFHAGKIKRINSFYPSPGFCNEIIHLFEASELIEAEPLTTDPDEIIVLKKFSLTQCNRLIKEGIIVDGKTIIAIQQLFLKD